MSLEQLEIEVLSIRSNTVALNSRSIYTSSTVRFLQWTYVHKQYLLTPGFLELLVLDTSRIPTKDSTKAALLTAPNNPPILFEALTANDFLTWVVSLRKADGTSLSYPSYNSHRSALFNLFRNFGKVTSKIQESEIQTLFKGLKRTVAQTIARGEAEVKVGKDPLSFSLYRYPCLTFFQEISRDFIFARTFMILC
jgi:hypothetical protein